MLFQDGLTGSAWGDWATCTDSPLRAFDKESVRGERGICELTFCGHLTFLAQLSQEVTDKVPCSKLVNSMSLTRHDRPSCCTAFSVQPETIVLRFAVQPQTVGI